MLVEGSWQIFYSGGPVVRLLKFACSAKPFIGISILGHRDGSIQIDISNEALKQLRENKIFLENPIITTCKLFELLDCYYEFPKDLKHLVHSLIKSGNWTLVTPLTEEQELFFLRIEYDFYHRQHLGQFNPIIYG